MQFGGTAFNAAPFNAAGGAVVTFFTVTVSATMTGTGSRTAATRVLTPRTLTPGSEATYRTNVALEAISGAAGTMATRGVLSASATVTPSAEAPQLTRLIQLSANGLYTAHASGKHTGRVALASTVSGIPTRRTRTKLTRVANGIIAATRAVESFSVLGATLAGTGAVRLVSRLARGSVVTAAGVATSVRFVVFAYDTLAVRPAVVATADVRPATLGSLTVRATP